MNSVAPPADPWVSRWRFAPRVRDVVAVVVALFFALAWLHAVVVGPSSSSSEGPPALADGLGWLAGTGVGAAVSAAATACSS